MKKYSVCFMFSWIPESCLQEKTTHLQNIFKDSCRPCKVKGCRFLSNNWTFTETTCNVIYCLTTKLHKKGIPHPRVCIQLICFHLCWQRERQAHWRQTRWATLSQLEGSCPKGRNRGEKIWESDAWSKETLLWPNGAKVFEVLIKIHTG